jgi:undecaprenyl-diphosphatase
MRRHVVAAPGATDGTARSGDDSRRIAPMIGAVLRRPAADPQRPMFDDEAFAGSTPVTLPTPIAARRSHTAERAALLGLAGFGALFAAVKARRSEAVDLALTLRWQGVRHPTLGRLMEIVSWPGFPPQSRVIPPVLMAGQLLLRLRLEAFMQLLAWGTGGLSEIIKHQVRRGRPVAGKDLRVVTAPLGGTSFPSGHVLTYVGTYGWLAYAAHSMIRPRWPRRMLVAGLAGLIGLVGPSRIHQGHHWPTDVAASYLLGMTYLVGLAEIYRRLRGRDMRHGEEVPG